MLLDPSFRRTLIARLLLSAGASTAAALLIAAPGCGEPAQRWTSSFPDQTVVLPVVSSGWKTPSLVPAHAARSTSVRRATRRGYASARRRLPERADLRASESAVGIA